MESRKRILVLLLVSFFLSVALADKPITEDAPEDTESDLDNQESSNAPQIQRRSGLFHGAGLHYHPYTYAKSFYTPVVKYPVYKTFAATPLHHVHAYARPQYSLHHGGATVTSYNVNYPRYPLYRPILKVPTTTILKPTVLSAPGFAPIAPVAPITPVVKTNVLPAAGFAPIAPIAPVIPQKPIIPIAINPVLPAVNRPIVYPQAPVFNPALFSGLNPQLIPVSVSNGAVFTNYPTLAPTPIAPSAWKPIAVPTVPTTIVQRPSISILPPLGPSSTVATLADPIHNHQFAQHVPSPTPVTVSAESHDHHQHFLPSGQGEVFNYQPSGSGFSSQGNTATANSAPSNSYLGPSSYDVDLNSVQQQQNQHNNIYHPDGGYQ